MVERGLRHFLFLVLGCLVMNVQADSASLNQISLERESDFPNFVEQTLSPFWQQNAIESSFNNAQGLTINYVFIAVEGATQAIVVSPGRVEGYLKYKELAYDFVQQGYAVFIIDHQGQGLSSRRLSNPHKGYVEDFEDYVDDFEQFIEQVVKAKGHQQLMLVAHSMGGAIATRFIQRRSDVFEKVVLSSPMLGFRSGPVPASLAKGMVDLGHWASSMFVDESPYFIGGEDYQEKNFADNELTSSQTRYDLFRNEYRQQPKLQLGGVTFSWLKASVVALDNIFNDIDKIKTPILLFQSEKDTVIDNEAQDAFCAQLKAANNLCIDDGPIVIKDAKHELFIESDDKRNQVLTQLIAFLK